MDTDPDTGTVTGSDTDSAGQQVWAPVDTDLNHINIWDFGEMQYLDPFYQSEVRFFDIPCKSGGE